VLAVDTGSRRRPPLGTPRPRLAPPRPLKSTRPALREEAACLGITFMPWQDETALYIEAVDAKGNWLFQEVPVVVGRQNGKTEILVPHICRRLRMGRRIMHTAQNRELPRDVFGRVADHMMDKHAELLSSKPRFANGQEEIRLRNGGRYRIVAPTRGGARGPSNDDLLIDEIRELVDHEFIGAAKPTLSASPNPQIVYLSNAGTAESAVLNALRLRATEGDPTLALLEWSAAPERAPDDVMGWRESNPAIGHLPGKMANLENEYRAHLLGKTMPIFEVEYLCRTQTSVTRLLVKPEEWEAQDRSAVTRPQSTVMAVKVDISGERASAVVAWRIDALRIALVPVADVLIDVQSVDTFGPELVKKAQEWRVSVVGFDPYTDTDLIRHFRRNAKIIGRDYANASQAFADRSAAGQFVISDPTDLIATDLAHTVRKPSTNGTFIAGKADETPNTAAEAAVRASWLAVNTPTFLGPARIQ
jgi:hypothetical protein